MNRLVSITFVYCVRLSLALVAGYDLTLLISDSHSLAPKKILMTLGLFFYQLCVNVNSAVNILSCSILWRIVMYLVLRKWRKCIFSNSYFNSLLSRWYMG